MTAVLRAANLTKKFRSGGTELVVLDGLDFEVASGEMVAIMGASGSGKTTLLQILGMLDRPTSGELYFQQKALSGCSLEEVTELRNRQMGFVWQSHYLLPEFTALENVSMPLRIRGMPPAETEAAGRELLAEVGLADRAEHRPGELSGGEQQRVALARALVGRPALLFADEPTGSLDLKTGDMVFSLLEQLHRTYRLTSIIATHNPGFAERCQRVMALDNGRLQPVMNVTERRG